MLAVFKHILKSAVFKHLAKLAVFTKKNPLSRARYRTVIGVKRTIPNGSIRHV
jgi:hypothetical protein